MGLKSLIATSMTVLTLGYCGIVSASEDSEFAIYSDNESVSCHYGKAREFTSFTMKLNKSRCELNISLFTRGYGSVYHDKLHLVDLNCDKILDQIVITQEVTGDLVLETNLNRSTDLSAHRSLFNTATRNYLRTLDKYGLMQKAEKRIDETKQGMKKDLETFFK